MSCPPPPPDDDNFDRLIYLLREMFQLDRGDLDFGLYRIMKLKSDEIERFLTEELLPQVSEALELAQAVAVEEAKQRYDEALRAAKETANEFDIKDPEQARSVKEAKKDLDAAKSKMVDPADIYADLHRFFARYYDSGDFMSLKRYTAGGKEAFLIPYNGEEVKLHWANADQYYIKTTANYQSYLFNLGADGQQVRFQIAAIDTEKDNIKETDDKKRRFVLAKDNLICEEDGVLIVNFEHRPLTDKEKNDNGGIEKTQRKNLNTVAHKRILEAAKKIDASWEAALAAPAPTEANPDRTVLQKHIEKYVAGNEFDYFIHKDLGGFLIRELDFFLKNEVLVLDNVQDDADALRRTLVRMKAIRSIGGKIIAFLAQLEEFQKRLWLKKKFVLQTEYCITLGRVPEGFYAEIADNKAQVVEWKKLFVIDDTKDGKKPSVKFLKDNPFLVLDTAYFDMDFKDRLLGALSDLALGNGECLEDTMDGLLIHGENFQALNLLQARYKQKVQCIHIDPPYNTDTSGFIYKNGYRHSSWLSMMHDRVLMALSFMSEQAAFLCHIDENEYERLHQLMGSFMPEYLSSVIWDKKNPMMGSRGIATQHEYIIWMANHIGPFETLGRDRELVLATARKIIKEHGGVNNDSRSAFAKWIMAERNLSGGTRAYRFLEDDGRVYRGVAMGWPNPNKPPEQFFVPLIHPVTKKPCPVPPRGWSTVPEKMQELVKKNEIIFGPDETTQPNRKVYLEGGAKRPVSSVISDASRGRNEINNLGLEFSYCHPSILYEELNFGASSKKESLNLDYFAGSGTTGHAIINLNREDGGGRKYILVEVGHHFDTVLLPRLKKVIYSHDWKNGKPVSREGSAQFFKYLRIESYEDTLDGLESIMPDDDLMSGLQARELREDYLLRYQLTHETQTSATLMGEDFDKPEGYTLSIVRDGTRRDETADLAETFNYLLGLKLSVRWRIDGVLVIKGIDPGGMTHLILWRDVADMPNRKLDAWFKQNRSRFGDDIGNIYVNGDQTLNTVTKEDGESWCAQSIEPTFRDLMFEGR